MKSGHSILSIIALLFSISSCIRPADLETGEMSVTVNCILNYPSPTQTLTLSYSIPNGKDTGSEIDRADVSLYDQTKGAVAGTFAPIGDGEWQASIFITPGHQYRLDINVAGERHISATTTVPKSKEMSYRPNGIAMWVSDIASSSLNRALCSTEYDLSMFDTPAWMYILNYNTAAGSHIVANLIAGNGQVDEFNCAGGLMNLDTEWKNTLLNMPEYITTSIFAMSPEKEAIHSSPVKWPPRFLQLWAKRQPFTPQSIILSPSTPNRL